MMTHDERDLNFFASRDQESSCVRFLSFEKDRGNRSIDSLFFEEVIFCVQARRA